MSYESVLTIVGFAISAGGFIPLLVLRDERRKIAVLTTTIAAAALSTGLLAYDRHQSESMITTIQHEVATALSDGPLTFDQIYTRLHYRPFPKLTEAIFRAVEKGEIRQKQIELFRDGASVPARVYYRTFPQSSAST